MSIEKAEVVYDEFSDGIGNWTNQEFQEAVEVIMNSEEK